LFFYEVQEKTEGEAPAPAEVAVKPEVSTENSPPGNAVENKPGNATLSPITVKSTPQNATVFIDYVEKGVTDLGLYILSGVHDIQIEHPDYLPVREKISVAPTTDKSKNVFSHNLVKNKGILSLSVVPANAVITLDGKMINSGNNEITPGKYLLEVKAPHYTPFSEMIEVQFGKTVNRSIELRKKAGNLQFTIKPISAKVALKQYGEVKYSWEGINLIENIQAGNYDLLATSHGYVDYTDIVSIKEGEIVVLEIDMKKWSDVGNLIPVSGGSFRMGCTEEQGAECERRETPAHEVTLNDFYIGKYEVTQELWQSVMSGNPSEIKGAALPVTNVTWFDAVYFCNKLSELSGLQPAYKIKGESVSCDFTTNGFRLPTEAGWEFAARGGKNSKNLKYSGSNNISSVAWYSGNSGQKTHPVGEKQPNELGLYDMSGNVWEWCWDWFELEYYSSSGKLNPLGPTAGENRVARGGSWYHDPKICRVSYRNRSGSQDDHPDVGFRLVRTK